MSETEVNIRIPIRRTHESAQDLIKQWEGLRLTAYKDVAGIWTIGYGHTGPEVHQGMRITEADADRILEEDLDRFETAVDTSVSVGLNDYQFGALVSFSFNVGVAAFQSSTLLKKLNRGDYSAVPIELAKWNKATVTIDGKKQLVVVRGLVNRRAAEAGLWVKGDFVQSNTLAAEPPQGVVAANVTPLSLGGLIGVAGPAIAALNGLPWQTTVAIAGGAAAVALTFILLRAFGKSSSQITI